MPFQTRNRLVAFLYELGRDHLPLGVIEAVAQDSETQQEYVLSNDYLAHYAQSVAQRLGCGHKTTIADVVAFVRRRAPHDLPNTHNDLADQIERGEAEGAAGD